MIAAILDLKVISGQWKDWTWQSRPRLRKRRIVVPETDRRSHHLHVAPDGVAMMWQAVEIWRTEHEMLQADLNEGLLDTLRQRPAIFFMLRMAT